MCYLSAPIDFFPLPLAAFMSFPHLSLPIHYKLPPLCAYLHVYIHTSFIDLWQPCKAGLDKFAHIHTSKTLQVIGIKQRSRRNLVTSCLSCVSVVHTQIVTGWAIILHSSFTLNADLKFNIKIHMLYFHITEYCGNTAPGLATYAA